jgi:hypothetical protein
MGKIADNKGIWIKEGAFKILVEPSEDYFMRLEQEKITQRLNPEFKEPNVSTSEIQMANFILDITERLEKLEGGSA